MKWESKGALITAIIAGIVASLCCVGPLVLLLLGIGSAWISTLTVFAPWRPVAIVITLLFLGLAFWQLYLRPRSCALGEACAVPSKLRLQRVIFWIVAIILFLLLTIPWYASLFY